MRRSSSTLSMYRLAGWLGPLLWLLLLGPAATAAKTSDADLGQAEGGEPGLSEARQSASSGETDPNRLTREGLTVEFSAQPAQVTGEPNAELMEGDHAQILFRITQSEGGEPVPGIYPIVWLDMAAAWNAKNTRPQSCKERVGIYLQGMVGIRPMVDLNSYFVLVMNQDPTISVIDPIVGISGRTKLYAQIVLDRPGADWAKTADEKRLFVSMPIADKLAVVDTERFKVIGSYDAGESPMRVVLQDDGKYLWVGNDARRPEESGVTVIDVDAEKVVAFIATGRGHHEIALSSDQRYAFVSNRDAGTVSVIDVQTLKKIKDIATGPTPISLAFSALSETLYVADGKSGVVSVVDSQRHEIVARIDTLPGLGPLRFSEDGRWGLVVNPAEDKVYVIDAATNRLAHTVPVAAKPYQLAFSRGFAYIRALDSQQVSLINLASLGKGDTPTVNTFPAGELAPGKVKDLSIADTIAPAAGEAAMLVVSPADNTVYYYMEGMNAPMGNFLNYGHRPRAVGVVDRTLKEQQPGVYSAKVKIPAAGTYDVAFLMESPRILHCFKFTARPNPLLEEDVAALAIDYLIESRKVRSGETLALRFRLTDPKTQQARTGLEDVRVQYFLAPTSKGRVVVAREISDGVYEAPLSLAKPGAYYISVAVPSLEVTYDDLNFLTLRALSGPDAILDTKLSDRAPD